MKTELVDFPPRPTIPPLAIAAATAWVTVLLVEELSWHLSWTGASMGNDAALEAATSAKVDLHAPFIIVAFLVGVALLPLLRALLRRSSIQMPGPRVVVRECARLLLTAFMTGFICSAVFWNAWYQDVQDVHELLEDAESIEIAITGDPTEKDYGLVSNAEVRIENHSSRLRVLWPDGQDPVSPGYSIQASGTLSSIKPDDLGRWNHQNGFIGMMRLTSIEAIRVTPSLQGATADFRAQSFERISNLDETAASLLCGVLLGNRTLFADTALEQSFRTTGLAHLMAVSGTHLAIVTALVSIVLGKTRLRRRPRSILVLLALMTYVSITGFAPSAMRACLMCAIVLFLGALKRRSFALNGLCLCVVIFLNLNPALAFAMGFQLSVLSVFGLIVFSPLFLSWSKYLLPKAPSFLVSTMAATLAASSMTLPLTAAQFAQLPIISPLANMIAAPLVTAALCLGVIGLVLSPIMVPLGTLVLSISGAIANLCATLVDLLAGIPGACLPVSLHPGSTAALFIVFFATLWMAWPTPRPSRQSKAHHPSSKAFQGFGALCLIILPLGTALLLGFEQIGLPTNSGDSCIVMLDVGQGDAILVRSKEAAILIDTGENSDRLLRELAEQSISHLNAVFITHKDADHCGALEKLAGIIAVDHVYVHDDLLSEPAASKLLGAAQRACLGKRAEGVRTGESFTIGNFTLDVVAPEQGGQSRNDDSLIMLLAYDADQDGTPEVKGLLTGDGEHEAIEPIVDIVGSVDFIKVAHHGSKDGVSDEQLSILDPAIALISVGADNKYGHPHPSTLDQYRRNGARIYRTDEQGAVTLRFSQNGYAVYSER